ncbi:TonB-dependent receptor plug domain-containing protein [Methylomonas sp. MgM2]
MRNLERHYFMHLLFLNCMTGNVYAQQSMDDLMALSPAELSDISVSIASGTATTLSHSAAVTSVITAEQIEEMGATELYQVLETIPGLHANLQPVTYDYSYSMRGISNDTNAEVLLLMDGSRFSTPYQGTHMAGMIIPVKDIQRVEVIRGPGSALYGADAFVGVINIITKKASDLNGATVGARGGNADTTSAWGQYGGQWQGWNIAASLQFNHNDFDPNRIIAADAQSQIDAALGTNASLAPGPMQTQNQRWNGHLNLQRKHWDLSFWAFNETDYGMRAGAAGALDNRGQGNGSNYLGDIRYSTEDAIEDWELQAHASFLYTDSTANIYNFPAGSLLPIDANGNVTEELSSTAGLVLFPDGMRFNPGFKTTMPSFELTSIYKGFSNHLLRMVAGFRYEELDTSEVRNFGVGVIDGAALLPPPNVNLAPNMRNVTDTPYTFIGNHQRDIWSMALQDEWQIAENWHLTTGVRYDHYSDFGSTWNPRAALVWDITTKLTGKLLYGHAYRAPSFLELYQKNTPLFTGNPSLQPETIETTELAFDYRPAQNLRTALNLYHYEIQDLIGGNINSNDLTVQNTAGQNGYGSEFEWNWQFHPDWNLQGNYAWQFARDENTNNRVPYVPEHHVYSALAWNFMPKWKIQTQVNWIGHRTVAPGDSRALDDYETVDITLNAKRLMGYVDLKASARNVFDSQGKEPAVNAYPDNIPIQGQSFYVEASIHF